MMLTMMLIIEHLGYNLTTALWMYISSFYYIAKSPCTLRTLFLYHTYYSSIVVLRTQSGYDAWCIVKHLSNLLSHLHFLLPKTLYEAHLLWFSLSILTLLCALCEVFFTVCFPSTTSVCFFISRSFYIVTNTSQYIGGLRWSIREKHLDNHQGTYKSQTPN